MSLQSLAADHYNTRHLRKCRCKFVDFPPLKMKIPSQEWSRMVINLYRNLLKQGKVLRFTEQGYYRRQLRKEFERQRDDVDVTKIKDQYEVNSIFLNLKMYG